MPVTVPLITNNIWYAPLQNIHQRHLVTFKQITYFKGNKYDPVNNNNYVEDANVSVSIKNNDTLR